MISNTRRVLHLEIISEMEILKEQTHPVGVLAPLLLKDIIRHKAEKAENNSPAVGMGSEYKFRNYKK